MVIRLGVMILVAALICGSTQAQSILLAEGERGVFVQTGYLGSSGVNSFELDLGYAFTDRIDVGAGAAYSDIGNQRSETSAGQFANAYPLKTRSRSIKFLVGLHEAYAKTFDGYQRAWLGLGTSLNLKVRVNVRTELIFSAGYNHATSDGATRDNATYGVAVASRIENGTKLKLFIEQISGNGPEVYAVGVGYTWAWRRR